MKKLLAIFATAAILLTSSGCVANEDTKQTETKSAIEELGVTEKDFQDSLKGVTKKYDDFDDTYRYEPELSKALVSKSGESWAYVITTAYEDSNGKFSFTFSPAYSGPDWVFFDNIQIKTSAETFEWDFDVNSGSREVLPDGGVAEIQLADVPDTRLKEFLAIADDPDSKFRLNGSEGNTFTGKFSKASRKALRDTVNVYVGLKLGYKEK